MAHRWGGGATVGKDEIDFPSVLCNTGPIIERVMGNCLPSRHVIKYHANGRKAREYYFRFGTRVGRWKCWYDSGQMKEITIYSPEGRVDEQYGWFETGLPSFQIRFEGRVVHHLSYHENGNPKEQWHTKKVWKWTRGGQIPMYEDVLCGPRRLWDGEGNLIEESGYEGGADGSVRWWRDDGSLE